MYQPRRLSDAQLAAQADGLDAFATAPRRAARTRVSKLRGRVVPTAVSVALLATAGAFALNFGAAEASQQAVPAPVRAEDDVTRDAERLAVQTAPQTEQAADTQADAEPVQAAALVAGTWSDAFGAIAGEKYSQGNLVIRSRATSDSEQLGTLKVGEKVSITDRTSGEYREIVREGTVAYVLDARLGDAPPAPPKPKAQPKATAKAPAKTTTKAATSGSSSTYTGSTSYSGKSVLGLRPSAMVVYNAVTAKWSFTSVGGYRASSLSNHQLGLAIDFMVYSDKAKGDAVANYLIANAAAFNIDHIIWRQRIWTPYNPTWRAMADRGSITANHYDHVHVSMKG